MEISEIKKKLFVQLSRMQRIDSQSSEIQFVWPNIGNMIVIQMKKNTHLEVNVAMTVNMLP